MKKENYNALVRAGVIIIEEEKPKTKIKLKNVMTKLKILNERGIINALSIQNNYMNTPADYTYVSFRIPKNNHKKEVIK